MNPLDQGTGNTDTEIAAKLSGLGREGALVLRSVYRDGVVGWRAFTPCRSIGTQPHKSIQLLPGSVNLSVTAPPNGR